MGQPVPEARSRTEHPVTPAHRPDVLRAALDVEWAAFVDTLAAFLGGPEERKLVLSTPDSPYYVQVATGNETGGHAEAVSNHFLPEETRLGPEQLAALESLGWLAPTGSPQGPKEARGPGWMPNHFVRLAPPVDWSGAASILVGTLAGVFGVASPSRLEYQAFDGKSRRVEAPELGLMEHPSRPTGAGENAGARPATPLLQGYLAFLGQQGFRPWTEEGSPRTAYFRSEGRTFSLRVTDGDPDFVHLSLGFTLKEGHDELMLLRAAMRCQGDIKVSKIYVSPDSDFVEFQTELFLGGHTISLDLLERCLATTRGLAENFFDAIDPEVPGAKA